MAKVWWTMAPYCYYLARQMLQDRGYVVAAALSPNSGPSLCLNACASDASRKILVVFCEDFQCRKQHMIEILSQIVDKEMLDKLILILQSKLNYHAQKVLDNYPVKTETFLITKHCLHPKYDILISTGNPTFLPVFCYW